MRHAKGISLCCAAMLLGMNAAVAAKPVSLKARDVRTFQVLDSRNLIVTTWHRYQWRITLSGFCIDLEGSHSIGFSSGPINGEIDQFGSVLTRMSSCPILKVAYVGREPPRRGKTKPESADAKGGQP